MEDKFSYKFYNSTSSAWDAMYRAILSAQKSIYWEVYIFMDDAHGRRFVELLCQKAKAGVEVKLIIDAIGSFLLTNASVKRLRSSGVKVLFFNRLFADFRLGEWWRKIWVRTHRKVLIVDEEIAFIGGVNIHGASAEWDDVMLELRGYVTRPLARGFAKTYVRSGGDPREVKHLLHPKMTAGLDDWRDKINYILNAPPYSGFSPMHSFYNKALGVAKESFNLLTPYYVPGPRFLELVARARKRGVKVNIIMPYHSDMRLMGFIGRAFYGISEKVGAAFYFLRKMNHGKAATVDNSLGLVGSANLTPRGFLFNQEAGAVFSEEGMVNDLNHILDDWKKGAAPMDEVGFRRQGWYRRFKDWWVSKLRDLV